MKVELVEPATVSGDDVAAWQLCAAACARDVFPGEPVPPVAFIADRARYPGTHRPLRYLLAWDDARSRVLGSAEMHWLDGAESHRVQTYLEVVPNARRTGVGTALLAAARELARAAGRTSLLGSARHDGGAVDFARAVGARFGLDEFRSVRIIADPVPDARAVPGLSIVRWEAECPEQYVASFADLRGVMNTAPQGGDVTFADDNWDAARIRRIESTLHEQRVRLLELTARDDATDQLVGYTEVATFDSWPEVGEQWDTAVRPEYRGRGVARWLKTEMLRWLPQQRPQLQMVSTWNATVNDAMLAVNVALGYGNRQRWIDAEVAV